jgi:FMN phosphatase YigB (HAD superfamily)
MEKEPKYNLLREILLQNGIDTLVTDLDNTIWDTTALFGERMHEICGLFGREFRENPERLFAEMREIIFALEGEFSVRPVRVHLAAILIARRRGLEKEHSLVKETLSLCDDIYTDTPQVYKGVPRMLWQFKLAGVRIIAATHAEEEWTKRKLCQTGTFHLFDRIVCIDVNKPKGEDQWRDGLVGVDLKRAILLGDNPVADIVSTNNLGFALRALVLNSRSANSVPQDVMILDKTPDLISEIEVKLGGE